VLREAMMDKYTVYSAIVVGAIFLVLGGGHVLAVMGWAIFAGPAYIY
jgi:hypothetical protein